MEKDEYIKGTHLMDKFHHDEPKHKIKQDHTIQEPRDS